MKLYKTPNHIALAYDALEAAYYALLSLRDEDIVVGDNKDFWRFGGPGEETIYVAKKALQTAGRL